MDDNEEEVVEEVSETPQDNMSPRRLDEQGKNGRKWNSGYRTVFKWEEEGDLRRLSKIQGKRGKLKEDKEHLPSEDDSNDVIDSDIEANLIEIVEPRNLKEALHSL